MKYNVHMEVSVRVKVHVEADSPEEAARRAEDLSYYEIIKHADPTVINEKPEDMEVRGVEWNEGILGAIVDEVDPETGEWNLDERCSYDLLNIQGEWHRYDRNNPHHKTLIDR